jgi:hypothetical protein
MTMTGGAAGRFSTSRSDAAIAAGVDASTPSAARMATTDSAATSTGRSSWSLYSIATPWAAASRASFGETVTDAVLPRPASPN